MLTLIRNLFSARKPVAPAINIVKEIESRGFNWDTVHANWSRTRFIDGQRVKHTIVQHGNSGLFRHTDYMHNMNIQQLLNHIDNVTKNSR